jgi:hypothetical protein
MPVKHSLSFLILLLAYSCAGWHHHEVKKTQLNLKLNFREMLPEPVTVIVYSLFDATALIGNDGTADLRITT